MHHSSSTPGGPYNSTPSTLLQSPRYTEDEAILMKFRRNSSIEAAAGKHGDVFFVDTRTPPLRKGNTFIVNNHTPDEKSRSSASHSLFAIKRQKIRSPSHLTDKSYRECRILFSLNSLIHSSKCINFIEMISWFKAKPSFLTPLKPSSTKSASSKKIPQLLHLVLEYADKSTLAHYKNNNELSLHQYRSILFQIFYALYVGQQEFEFVHNDLHAGNILLKSFPSEKKYLTITDKSQTWTVAEFIVKLADFGLSRISMRDSKEVIYNATDAMQQLYNPKQDVQQLARVLKHIKVDMSGIEDVYRDLRKCIVRGTDPERLIRHAFFEPLKSRPVDTTKENTIFVSSANPISISIPLPSFSPSIPSSSSTGQQYSSPYRPQPLDNISDAMDKLSLNPSSSSSSTSTTIPTVVEVMTPPPSKAPRRPARKPKIKQDKENQSINVAVASTPPPEQKRGERASKLKARQKIYKHYE